MEDHHRQQPLVSGKTAAMASLAGLATGGPLLGLAGFSLMASVALLLVASPPLVLLSPVLLGAVSALVAALAGFGVAAAAAVAGMAAFRWAFRELRMTRRVGAGERGKGLGELMLEESQGDERFKRG